MANEVNKANIMANEADKTNKADNDKADEAAKAIVANEVSKIIVADKANVIDAIVAANEVIVTNTANWANKANKASFVEANKLLANDSIAIVLFSLTKYCEVFAKDEGYFGMTISNNQRGIDS
jgi:hypothetical protein